MHSLNKVFLFGRVGQTPELLTTKTGAPYTRISLATHRTWKDGDSRKEVTDWHSVMVWGNLAKVCTQGITKGSVVLIEGHLNPYKETGDDGQNLTRQSIHAHSVSFLPAPSQSTSGEDGLAS